MAKRLFDIVMSALGLVLLAPAFAVTAIAIKADSEGPIFYRQDRVGRYGKLFQIHKFRTMRVNNTGPQLTVAGDPRVTRVGKFLRQYKLDEFPQLLDVLAGSMSLVGPRPEVPRYVAVYPESSRRVVLSVRPGITDLASIHFRNENDLLASSRDPDVTYRETILPIKLRYYEEYVAERSFWFDCKVLWKTFLALGRVSERDHSA